MCIRDRPKSYEPGAIETRWAEYWVKEKLFSVPTPPEGETRPVFTLLLPPPNVTGRLHMGHMLNQTQMDIIVRWHRMSGFITLWLPGTDHAGIATQMMVERDLAKEGKKRRDLGREKFIERVWEWKKLYGGAILDQMKRLGASVDWDREYFTMDENLSHAVREVFVRLYEEGLIYRGKYIVNWCPRCETAISDLEVKHEEVAGKLWEIRYPVVGTNEFITAVSYTHLDVYKRQAVSMMRFGPDNDLYLLVQYGDSLEIVPNQQSIWRFDGMTGAPKGEVISKASPNTPNSLNFSADFDIGPDGTIYALKVFNQGILRFSGATGEFLDVFAPGSSVPDVYLIQFTPDRKLLYVAGSSDITEFDLTGTKTNYFKTSVTGIGGITFLPTSLPQGPTAPNRNIPINAIITIIIFGVRDDGPGVSYTPGRPPQSDPWPVWMYIAGLVWRDLQPDDRDVLIAFGIEQLGSLMSNQTSREAVQAAVKKGLSKPMLARLQRLIARHRRSVPLPA